MLLPADRVAGATFHTYVKSVVGVADTVTVSTGVVQFNAIELEVTAKVGAPTAG